MTLTRIKRKESKYRTTKIFLLVSQGFTISKIAQIVHEIPDLNKEALKMAENEHTQSKNTKKPWEKLNKHKKNELMQAQKKKITFNKTYLPFYQHCKEFIKSDSRSGRNKDAEIVIDHEAIIKYICKKYFNVDFQEKIEQLLKRVTNTKQIKESVNNLTNDLEQFISQIEQNYTNLDDVDFSIEDIFTAFINLVATRYTFRHPNRNTKSNKLKDFTIYPVFFTAHAILYFKLQSANPILKKMS